MTALHHAAWNGYTAVPFAGGSHWLCSPWAARDDSLEMARLLIESGADVNAKVSIASGCRLLQPPPRVGLRSNRTG